MNKHLVLTALTLSVSISAIGNIEQPTDNNKKTQVSLASIQSLCKNETLSCVQTVDLDLATCVNQNKTADHPIASACATAYDTGTDHCYSIYKQCVMSASKAPSTSSQLA